ncbi:MAG: hypothetical protein SGJ11_15275, partial [Phycisphaerae bacterium]|nr:hypothetical protein [Phycisphaerae bacterium]
FVSMTITGNDDSMRSIDVIVRELCAAVSEGLGHRQTSDAVQSKGGDADGGDRDGGPRRRSTRSRFRAEGGDEAPAPVEAPASAE